MQRFSEGDHVRIDIPDETDPDHQEYHGLHGRIVTMLGDDADALTADVRDAQLYRIVFDSGETGDFRWRDLRPPLDDSSHE